MDSTRRNPSHVRRIAGEVELEGREVVVGLGGGLPFEEPSALVFSKVPWGAQAQALRSPQGRPNVRWATSRPGLPGGARAPRVSAAVVRRNVAAGRPGIGWRRVGPVFWGLSVAAAALFAAPVARGYCRSNTCQVNHSCAAAHYCPVGGLDLAWKQACLSYSVQQDIPAELGLDLAEAEALVDSALRTWTTAPCMPDLPLQMPSVAITNAGSVVCNRVELNECSGNANVWIFRSGTWGHSDEVHTLGLTTLQFNVTTGEMRGADVELNVPRILSEGVAFDKVITHEAGHFFGLDHSSYSEATMAEAPGMRNIAELGQDDIDGICATFPPGEDRGNCDPSPLYGFSAECGPASCGTESSGCQVGPPGLASFRTAVASSVAAVVVAVVVALGRRRGRAG